VVEVSGVGGPREDESGSERKRRFIFSSGQDGGSKWKSLASERIKDLKLAL